MAKPVNPIQMAVVGAAHGIKGEVRVRAFTGDPLALGDYGPLYDKDGRSFEVATIRPAKEVVVVRFRQVNDRSAAEALTGTELYVDRSALPEAVEEGEFYHADLIGMTVKDDTGEEVGKVIAVQNFGGGDILELTLGGRRGVLIPFTVAAVPEVDLEAGFVRIDSAAAGLIDDEDDGAAPSDGEIDRSHKPEQSGGRK